MRANARTLNLLPAKSSGPHSDLVSKILSYPVSVGRLSRLPQRVARRAPRIRQPGPSLQPGRILILAHAAWGAGGRRGRGGQKILTQNEANCHGIPANLTEKWAFSDQHCHAERGAVLRRGAGGGCRGRSRGRGGGGGAGAVAHAARAPPSLTEPPNTPRRLAPMTKPGSSVPAC